MKTNTFSIMRLSTITTTVQAKSSVRQRYVLASSISLPMLFIGAVSISADIPAFHARPKEDLKEENIYGIRVGKYKYLKRLKRDNLYTLETATRFLSTDLIPEAILAQTIGKTIITEIKEGIDSRFIQSTSKRIKEAIGVTFITVISGVNSVPKNGEYEVSIAKTVPKSNPSRIPHRTLKRDVPIILKNLASRHHLPTCLKTSIGEGSIKGLAIFTDIRYQIAIQNRDAASKNKNLFTQQNLLLKLILQYNKIHHSVSARLWNLDLQNKDWQGSRRAYPSYHCPMQRRYCTSV